MDAPSAMNDNDLGQKKEASSVAEYFDAAAAAAFSFLLDRGFEECRRSTNNIEYNRRDLSVNIFYGPRSCEIGFEVIRNEVRYSLSEIIRINSFEEAECYRNFVATTPDGVRCGVNKLREIVIRYADSVLRGDIGEFLALDRQRTHMAHALELRTEVATIKPRADAAFRSKRYAEAARLYDRIRPALTPAELKKADFARARAGR
jgi:hypothetical protein